MLNELLLSLAHWLDAMPWSTALHESLYLYAWVETTHVLTLMVFLGMLFIIDLRILGLIFADVPASTVAKQLDVPMLIGFTVMIATGFILYFAIPVRTTQSPVVPHQGGAAHHRRHQRAAVPSPHEGGGRQLGSRPQSAQAPAHRRRTLAGVVGGGSHYRTHHRLRLVRLPQAVALLPVLGGWLRGRNGPL